MGYFTAPWFHARLGAPDVSLFGFRLFFAVAMSITAIPILGRIFMELGLSHTRTAALTIGASAVDDVSGWLILGTISLLAKGAFTWGWALWRVVGLAVYLFGALVILRPILKRAVAKHLRQHGGMSLTLVPQVLLVLFASAVITSNLGVFAIVGGFVIGVALHDDRWFVEEWKRRVGPIVQALFLPIFFAYTGLRTDVGTIAGWAGFRMLLLVLAVAFLSKFAGAYAADRAQYRQGPGSAANEYFLHASDHGHRQHICSHAVDSLADERRRTRGRKWANRKGLRKRWWRTSNRYAYFVMFPAHPCRSSS